MTHDGQHEEQIFSEAIEIDDLAERGRFLADACGSDRELRQRVEQLIQAEEAGENLFARVDQAEERGGHPHFSGEQVGDQIGPYKLLERIGEGGFGSVYVAEQNEPIRRRVALKIIKLGMDTRQVIARFEVERQALALMDHPNIAKVFDAGTTSTGRPYFVMELVRGLPITRFCDEHRLSPEQRLRLFTEVCEAVQHAHQRGVIHRDLKPSNILVTLNGRKAVPKIIDFGIAKATHQPLTDKTLYTRFHQFIGTPEYISPEQAEMSEVPVDTRSDIYSLGVLLYELLVGRPPFASDELLKAGFDQMRKILREKEPLRPSRQLSRLNDVDLTTTAQRRQCSPPQLLTWFKGDLEHVVLKAIEKDVHRRYPSAVALADDIQRFLKQEPVTAVPPSRAYLARKFVRRHRVLAATGGAVAVSLLCGLTASLLLLVRARDAEQLAQQRLEDVLAAHLETQTQKEATDALNRWVTEDFLGLADAWEAVEVPTGQNDLSLKNAIIAATENLDERLDHQPLHEASIRLTAGRALSGLGEVEAAERNLRRAYELYRDAMGDADPNTLRAQARLGWALFRDHRVDLNEEGQRRREEGAVLLIKAFETSLETYGRDHELTVWTSVFLSNGHFFHAHRGVVGERVLSVFEQFQSQDWEMPGMSERLRLSAKRALAGIRESQGRFAEAKHLLKSNVEERGVWPRLEAGSGAVRVEDALDLFSYGRFLLWHENEYNEASELLADALAISKRTVGDGYPTWDILYYLSKARIQQERFEDAISLRREALSVREAAYGPNNAFSVNEAIEVSAIYAGLGRWEDSLTERDSFRKQGIVDVQVIAGESLLNCLLNRTKAALELRQEFWRYAKEHPAEVVSFANPHAMLIPPVTEPEMEPMVAHAGRYIEYLEDAGGRFGAWRRLMSELIHGVVAYRKESFKDAIDHLEPVAKNLRYQAMATIAGCFWAMAEHRIDHPTKALALRETYRARLETVIAPGYLHQDHPLRNLVAHWAALIALREAEQVILGEEQFAIPSAEDLTALRERWKPVRSCLETAEKAARSREYQTASDLYWKAMHEPSWDVFTAIHRSDSSPLATAAVFAVAGDRERYLEICRELFGSVSSDDPAYLRMLLISPDPLPDDLRNHLKRLVPLSGNDFREPDRNGVVGWAHWDKGMQHYRLGRYQESLKEFESAAKAYQSECIAASLAGAAMAAEQLGQSAQALEHYQKAKAEYERILELGHGTLPPRVWHDALAVELLLKEARQTLGL